MKNEIKLSPVELYFLGKQMHAKFIDYQYIADMPGIQDEYTFHEQETLRRLEERGVLIEDFGGNVEIDEKIREKLNPIFFGETESVVQSKQPYRFHVCNGKVTYTFTESEIITICEAGDAEIAEILAALGDEVSVVCAKVNEGMQAKIFTDLQKDEQIGKAIKFIKGGMVNGIL